MKKDGKFFTSVSVGAAAVWFSTHCGAGFASGAQELQYFANHGWYGAFLPIIPFAILAFTYYIAAETARQTDQWGYDMWAKEAYGHSKLAKPLVFCMDISIVIVTVAGSAAAIVTGGLLVNQYLGLPVLLGSLIMVVIVTLLCIFGEEVVRKNAMIMTAAILIIISIVIIAGLIKFAPDISRLMSERYVNPEATKWSVQGTSEVVKANFGNSLLWALTYAGFQASVIAGFTASFEGGKTKSESKGAVILGAILNIVMLLGICLLIFSQMPGIYMDESTRTLPTVFVVNQLNIKALSVLYPILLFLALTTTAVGTTFGLLRRIEPYMFKKMENPLKKKAIISAGSLLICYAVSTLGLMWVITVAYKYLGIFNWLFVILPLWILGTKNLRRRNREMATHL